MEHHGVRAGIGAGQGGIIAVELPIQSGRLDFLAERRVGLAQKLQLFRGRLAAHANGEPAFGERLTRKQPRRQAEQLAQLANFLAIQRVQRQKRKIARLSRAAHDGAPLIQKRVAQGLHYSLVLLACVGRAGERHRDLR